MEDVWKDTRYQRTREGLLKIVFLGAAFSLSLMLGLIIFFHGAASRDIILLVTGLALVVLFSWYLDILIFRQFTPPLEISKSRLKGFFFIPLVPLHAGRREMELKSAASLQLVRSKVYPFNLWVTLKDGTRFFTPVKDGRGLEEAVKGQGVVFITWR